MRTTRVRSDGYVINMLHRDVVVNWGVGVTQDADALGPTDATGEADGWVREVALRFGEQVAGPTPVPKDELVTGLSVAHYSLPVQRPPLPSGMGWNSGMPSRMIPQPMMGLALAFLA
jgi:hypothetical protein